jgi:hypothetical protein
MKYKIAMWTPGHQPMGAENLFGCSSHGFAAANAWHDPDAAGWTTWPLPVEGTAVAGTYAEILAKLGKATGRPQAAIILFAHGSGMEPFLEQWQGMFPGVPVAGGAAARAGSASRGELLPPAGDAAVLLIHEGTWRAEALNVHEETGPSLEFEADGPRRIARLRMAGEKAWQPAAAFFQARQAEHGRAAGDCESITFTDTGGRNLHCSFAGSQLQAGANLPAGNRLQLRTVPRAQAAARLAAFCAQPAALVFGCAGLRSLLDAPLPVAEGTLAGFMFGELVALAGRPQFGNLMGARLVRMGD